jgi:hypothetical protein
VQRHERVAAVPEVEPLERVRPLRARQMPAERVDHDVPDEVDLRLVGALEPEVADARRLAREEEVRDRVGQHAVHLLGHRPVEAPEPRLDVGDRDEALRGDERAGDRRVDVADDDDRVRRGLDEHRLEAPHDLGRLLRVRAGADLEVHVGARDRELVEEDLREALVPVLAGVDEARGDAGPRAQRLEERGDLNEVRPRAGDAEDLGGRHGRALQELS